MKQSELPSPMPVFDNLSHIKTQSFAHCPSDYDYKQIKIIRDFLLSYDGSEATFNVYRRELEKLFQWTALIKRKSILELNRGNIIEYIAFCQAPPRDWINTQQMSRFNEQDGIRTPNPEWKPFIMRLSKEEKYLGKNLDITDFELSQSAMKEIFAVLSSFYNFLIQEDIVETNPILQIRQKNKFIMKHQSKQRVRRLSNEQWQALLQTAETLANTYPEKHERTLFIITALYSMYLRISELAASKRWTPKMSDFHCDSEKRWWFTTVGKGNKMRDIAVSNTMLAAVKRYRTSLNLTPLPSPADGTPLLPKIKGHGAISDTSYIRKIVQLCFDKTCETLRLNGFEEEADGLLSSTVHWLRHTGISDDVKHRPREHVRDDAGHSSGAITDKYIDVELSQRHKSALNKAIVIPSGEE